MCWWRLLYYTILHRKIEYSRSYNIFWLNKLQYSIDKYVSLVKITINYNKCNNLKHAKFYSELNIMYHNFACAILRYDYRIFLDVRF